MCASCSLGYSVEILVGACIGLGVVCFLIGLLIGFHFWRQKNKQDEHVQQDLRACDSRAHMLGSQSPSVCNDDPIPNKLRYVKSAEYLDTGSLAATLGAQTNDFMPKLRTGDPLPPTKCLVKKVPLQLPPNPIYNVAESSNASGESSPNCLSPRRLMSTATPAVSMETILSTDTLDPSARTSISSDTPDAIHFQGQPSLVSHVWCRCEPCLMSLQVLHDVIVSSEVINDITDICQQVLDDVINGHEAFTCHSGWASKSVCHHSVCFLRKETLEWQVDCLYR